MHEIFNLTKWVTSKWNIDFFSFKWMDAYKICMQYQIVYIIFIIYQASNVKIVLNMILTNYFQIYF
jgi:hypothetical protein